VGFGGTGDLVAKGAPQVNKQAIRELVNETEFLRRVQELLAGTTDPAEITFWKIYIDTWEKPEEKPISPLRSTESRPPRRRQSGTASDG
jgi:hypothetical protein